MTDSTEVLSVQLGPEWDTELLARLRAAVTHAGGTLKERSWGVGGSQEITSYQIQLTGGEIEVTAETYMGLIIRGQSALVRAIAAEVKPTVGE